MRSIWLKRVRNVRPNLDVQYRKAFGTWLSVVGKSMYSLDGEYVKTKKSSSIILEWCKKSANKYGSRNEKKLKQIYFYL